MAAHRPLSSSGRTRHACAQAVVLQRICGFRSLRLPPAPVAPCCCWLSCRLADQAREVEKARREAAVKAVEYERTAKEELDIFVARRAAAKKVCPAADCAVLLAMR